LGDAIRQAATDSAMQSRAAALGAKIRAEDGVAEAVKWVEHYVAIKNPKGP
jgi:UDP:flavonoid glycosyltransferase YjiC (YdhE family)